MPKTTVARWYAVVRRYDALIHLDESGALRPLHEVHPHHEPDPAETYPWWV